MLSFYKRLFALMIVLICLIDGSRVESAVFHDLIREGELEQVRASLARDSVLANMADEIGMSPLHIAVISGHLRIVNVLINAGAEVNATDSLKRLTPLHYAAFHNYPRIMLFLLSRRADHSMADSEGNQALHFAAANGCYSTVDILLQHLANPDCLNKNWQTPLHLAAYAGNRRDHFPCASKKSDDYLDVTRLLLLQGATPGIRDIWQNLPETIAWQHSGGKKFAQAFTRLMSGQGLLR
jgi:ankyrin repeat protein